MSDIVLSERKKNLLLNAVGSFIDNALPITSEKVQTEVFNNLSSATLRNELSALESMGYLKQLHTSSGRVPTSKGYRFFVNEILKNAQLDDASLSQVKNQMFARTSNLTDIVDTIAKTISNATNYPRY